jgi:hypothetical protein
MKSIARTYAGTRSNDIAATWMRAVRGGERERSELLKSIMPSRRGR